MELKPLHLASINKWLGTMPSEFQTWVINHILLKRMGYLVFIFWVKKRMGYLLIYFFWVKTHRITRKLNWLLYKSHDVISLFHRKDTLFCLYADICCIRLVFFNVKCFSDTGYNIWCEPRFDSALNLFKFWNTSVCFFFEIQLHGYILGWIRCKSLSYVFFCWRINIVKKVYSMSCLWQNRRVVFRVYFNRHETEAYRLDFSLRLSVSLLRLRGGGGIDV